MLRQLMSTAKDSQQAVCSIAARAELTTLLPLPRVSPPHVNSNFDAALINVHMYHLLVLLTVCNTYLLRSILRFLHLVVRQAFVEFRVGKLILMLI